MTDVHPDDGQLLALALDDPGGGSRDSTLQHLTSCHRCRGEYDALSATVEQTLAAAPSVEPSPGFDARVLGAMGFDPSGPVEVPERSRHARSGRHRWQLVAASVAAGLAVGVGGSYAVSQLDDPPQQSTLAEDRSLLETPDGDRVGSVTRTLMDGEPVYVVTVTTGPVGMNYLCLLRLEDGKQIEVADWVLHSERGETWVIDVPAQDVSELVMVANGGAGPVWSTARL